MLNAAIFCQRNYILHSLNRILIRLCKVSVRQPELLCKCAMQIKVAQSSFQNFPRRKRF